MIRARLKTVPDAIYCPYCGNQSCDLCHYINETFAIICNGCDAEGPAGQSEAGALELWNKRVSGP